MIVPDTAARLQDTRDIVVQVLQELVPFDQPRGIAAQTLVLELELVGFGLVGLEILVFQEEHECQEGDHHATDDQ